MKWRDLRWHDLATLVPKSRSDLEPLFVKHIRRIADPIVRKSLVHEFARAYTARKPALSGDERAAQILVKTRKYVKGDKYTMTKVLQKAYGRLPGTHERVQLMAPFTTQVKAGVYTPALLALCVQQRPPTDPLYKTVYTERDLPSRAFLNTPESLLYGTYTATHIANRRRKAWREQINKITAPVFVQLEPPAALSDADEETYWNWRCRFMSRIGLHDSLNYNAQILSSLEHFAQTGYHLNRARGSRFISRRYSYILASCPIVTLQDTSPNPDTRPLPKNRIRHGSLIKSPLDSSRYQNIPGLPRRPGAIPHQLSPTSYQSSSPILKDVFHDLHVHISVSYSAKASQKHIPTTRRAFARNQSPSSHQFRTGDLFWISEGY